MSARTVGLRNTSYARLHESYAALAGPDSPDGNGHAAWIHRVGSPRSTRTHLAAQRELESADLGAVSAGEGFVARLCARAGTRCASRSTRMQRMYRAPRPNALHADTPTARRLLDGALAPRHDGRRFPRDAAEAAAANLPLVAPRFEFMQRCEDALHIARSTPYRVVGVELGGWDTHRDQIARRAALDPWLAHAIRSLYDLTRDQDDVYTILVVTEFGRTDRANSEAGTDHGAGGLMMLFGRAIAGGVYNCHAPGAGGRGVAPWGPLGASAELAASDGVQRVATDFRAVYAELLGKRFGMTMDDLEVILPGWGAVAGTSRQTTQLGCVV